MSHRGTRLVSSSPTYSFVPDKDTFASLCCVFRVRRRLGPLLRDFLEQYLPPDAHERCSGTTHVAVTRLLPYWRTQMVSHFDSREDLMAALLTSCHIPWWV